jgi:hypothetical protein
VFFDLGYLNLELPLNLTRNFNGDYAGTSYTGALKKLYIKKRRVQNYRFESTLLKNAVLPV